MNARIVGDALFRSSIVLPRTSTTVASIRSLSSPLNNAVAVFWRRDAATERFFSVATCRREKIPSRFTSSPDLDPTSQTNRPDSQKWLQGSINDDIEDLVSPMWPSTPLKQDSASTPTSSPTRVSLPYLDRDNPTDISPRFRDFDPADSLQTGGASHMRLGRSTGRNIVIDRSRNIDLATAMRRLDTLLARNSVKVMDRRLRFHERPGLRRKRLKSERWRRRFKDSFAATLLKVEAMKRKGW